MKLIYFFTGILSMIELLNFLLFYELGLGFLGIIFTIPVATIFVLDSIMEENGYY